jgi:serine/threonine protein kinase
MIKKIFTIFFSWMLSFSLQSQASFLESEFIKAFSNIREHALTLEDIDSFSKVEKPSRRLELYNVSLKDGSELFLKNMKNPHQFSGEKANLERVRTLVSEKVAAMLEDPNCPKITYYYGSFSFAAHTDSPDHLTNNVLIFERAPGQSVASLAKQLIESEEMEKAEIYFRAIGQHLKTLHTKFELIHGDLTAENIFVHIEDDGTLQTWLIDYDRMKPAIEQGIAWDIRWLTNRLPEAVRPFLKDGYNNLN